MQITEIFYSLQGEGLHAGLPTVFVRTTGCPLRCTWCDSAYSFHGGEPLAVSEILDKVSEHPTRRVCFTGGEPLVQKDAVDLVQRLLREGYETVIETSGSVPLDGYVDMQPRDPLCLSVDVKCPGSGEDGKNRLEELSRLAEHDQVKFVIGSEEDYAFARNVMEEHSTPASWVIQPVWGSDSTWLADKMLADGLDARFSLQVHKHLWGDKPGV